MGREPSENFVRLRAPDFSTDTPSWFTLFSNETARLSAKPVSFFAALLLIILWMLTGPYFNYSTTWLLAIETPATIVTFAMVFLIQNTQNRDMAALQLKLSELIFVMEGAQNRVAIAEHLSEREVRHLRNAQKVRAEDIDGSTDQSTKSR
jgi:low affinity Fe/Cu permease